MNKTLTINDLKILLAHAQKYQEEHPKATILYDVERMTILITYPLPKEFYDKKGFFK